MTEILNTFINPKNVLVFTKDDLTSNNPVEPNYLGKTYSAVLSKIYKGLQNTIDHIKKIGFRVFATLNAICSDPAALFHVFRRLDTSIIPFIEFKKGNDRFYELKRIVHSSLTIFDTIQVVRGVDYVMNSKYKKDNSLEISAKICLFVAHIGLFTKEMILLGSHKAVNIVNHFKTLRFASCFTPVVLFGAANAFFAVNAFHKLQAADTPLNVRDQQLELAKHVMDFVLNAMIFTSRFSLGGLCTIGCLSITFEVSSVLFKREHKKELTRTQKIEV